MMIMEVLGVARGGVAPISDRDKHEAERDQLQCATAIA